MVTVELKNKEEIILKIAEEGNTLREFSRKTGISQGYLSQILNGQRNPSPTVASKFAKALGLNINDIFLIKVIDKTII